MYQTVLTDVCGQRGTTGTPVAGRAPTIHRLSHGPDSRRWWIRASWEHGIGPAVDTSAGLEDYQINALLQPSSKSTLKSIAALEPSGLDVKIVGGLAADAATHLQVPSTLSNRRLHVFPDLKPGTGTAWRYCVCSIAMDRAEPRRGARMVTRPGSARWSGHKSIAADRVHSGSICKLQPRCKVQHGSGSRTNLDASRKLLGAFAFRSVYHLNYQSLPACLDDSSTSF